MGKGERALDGVTDGSDLSELMEQLNAYDMGNMLLGCFGALIVKGGKDIVITNAELEAFSGEIRIVIEDDRIIIGLEGGTVH